MKCVRFLYIKTHFKDNIPPTSVIIPQWQSCTLIFSGPRTPIQEKRSVTKAIWGGYIMMCHMPLPTCTSSLIHYLRVGHNLDVGPPCITAWFLYLIKIFLVNRQTSKWNGNDDYGSWKNGYVFLSLRVVPTGMTHILYIALIMSLLQTTDSTESQTFVPWFCRVVLSTELYSIASWKPISKY